MGYTGCMRCCPSSGSYACGGRVLRRFALFSVSGPGLLMLLACMGLRQDWIALLMLTLPIGACGAIGWSAVRAVRLHLQAREVLRRGLSVPSRSHLLRKPVRLQLAAAWVNGTLGAVLLVLASAACWDQCDAARVTLTVVLGSAGLGLLWRGLRIAADYDLSYDAWRDSTVFRARGGASVTRRM